MATLQPPQTATQTEAQTEAQTVAQTASELEADAAPVAFQRYYEEAGPDYAAWSPHFNMHFGFFRWGMNPCRREAMLEQMNREILDRLRLDTGHRCRVFDLGCGLAATLRSIARQRPFADLYGITLVPWQLEQGRRFNRDCFEGHRITLSLGDYERTPCKSASFDAVYALESSCYAHGANKSALLREACRLLRPGGRLVIADGFLGPGRLRGPAKAICRKLCECWVIDTLGEITQVRDELERLGFKDILIEPLQARVTPSVLHVPWVTLRFLLTTLLFTRRKMTRARWNKSSRRSSFRLSALPSVPWLTTWSAPPAADRRRTTLKVPDSRDAAPTSKPPPQASCQSAILLACNVCRIRFRAPPR